jgi:hypothetical protein
MAVSYKNAAIRITGPDLFELRQAFKRLPSNIAARVIGAGLRRAAKPGEAALKQITPKGPTGNLRRSIKTLVKRYPRDGAAVAVVGYVKAGTGKARSAGGGKVMKGPDRAFHQFWIEFGTADRYSKKPSARGGYIASSYRKFGPFVLKGAGKVQTSPAYPKAFFKKSATPVYLRSTGAQHPVETAFRMSKNAIAANLNGEMQKALQNGLKILEDQASRAAQMNDLAKHL